MMTRTPKTVSADEMNEIVAKINERPNLPALADEIEALPLKARAAQLPRIIRLIAEALS
jgi:hypothetical protein